MSLAVQPAVEFTEAARAPEQRPASVPAPGGSGMQLLRSLRRHKLLALAVLLLVAAIGAPLAWIKGTPVYSATAVVFVSPRFIPNLQDTKEVSDMSDSLYHEYVQQNAKTINRFDIVVEALRKLGPEQSVWVKPGETLEHAAERLQGALSIQPVPDTYQIAVSLERARPEGLADLVNSVVNTYLEKAKSEEFYASDQRVANLETDRARLAQEIQDKLNRRLQIAQELGVSSFTDNFVNPYDHLLVDSKGALSAARRQKIEAESQVAALDQKGSAALRAAAAVEASKDAEVTSLEANQSLRRTQLLTALSGLAPDHPGRKAVQKELADLDRERQDVYNRLADSYAKALLEQKRGEAFKTLRVEQQLSRDVEQESTRASWFSKNYQEGIQLGVEIDQLRKRVDNIQQRIDFFHFEKNAPGFVRLFSAARTPDEPSKGGRRKYAALVLIAALTLGLCAPLGVDALDPRVHTPRDVEKVLGFAPAAWILERRQAGSEFGREQSLRLASRILADHQTNNSRIFAFTPVNAGHGTTSIVMNTASGLKQLGARVLAIEANAFHTDPRLHGQPASGLTHVLRGQQTMASAVVAGVNGDADYLPLGDLSGQKNLPNVQRVSEIAGSAINDYSIVLMDLPPILASVDAELLARGADVTILTIEAERVSKQELQRAGAYLERARPKAVSAVLNGVRLDAGDGFARDAWDEFRTGGSKRSRGWFWRRLWS